MSRIGRVSGRGLLFLLLLAAVAWVVLLRARRPAPPEAHFGLPPGWGQTTRFVFARAADSIVVVPEGRAYWLVHPFRDRADPVFMKEVERQARTLKPLRVLPDTAGAAFGLDSPGAWARLQDETGMRWTLALGDSTPLGLERYARVRGRREVLLVERFSAGRYFTPSASALRDRVAASLNPGPVDSLAVLAGARSLRARRVSRELWVSREPPDLPLNPIPLAQIVQFFRNPEIKGFPDVSTPLAEIGLSPPRTIWVLFQGSRAESVRVGHATADQKSMYVLPAGRRYPALMGSDYFRSLVDGWPAVADLSLLSLDPDSLSAVQIEGPAGRISYVRQGGVWREEDAGSGLSLPRAFGRDLHNLALIRWFRYPFPAVPAPSGPRLRVVLRAPARAETLVLAAPVDTLAWARSSRQTRWGEVSARSWRLWTYRLEHRE